MFVRKCKEFKEKYRDLLQKKSCNKADFDFYGPGWNRVKKSVFGKIAKMFNIVALYYEKISTFAAVFKRLTNPKTVSLLF